MSLILLQSRRFRNAQFNAYSRYKNSYIGTKFVELFSYRKTPTVLLLLQGILTRNCSYSQRQCKPILTLYTKNPCPLCDEALKKLQPWLDQVILEKIDITAPENRKFWKAYCYDIPVFHLNGKFLMKHHANIDVFKARLKEHYIHEKDDTSV